jgi:hypothetical protein
LRRAGRRKQQDEGGSSAGSQSRRGPTALGTRGGDGSAVAPSCRGEEVLAIWNLVRSFRSNGENGLEVFESPLIWIAIQIITERLLFWIATFYLDPRSLDCDPNIYNKPPNVRRYYL